MMKQTELSWRKRRVGLMALVLLAGLAAGWSRFAAMQADPSPRTPAPVEMAADKTGEPRNEAEKLIDGLAAAVARGDEAETEAALAEISVHLETHPDDFSQLTIGLKAHPEIRRHLPELLRLTVQAGRYPVCAAAFQVVREETSRKDDESRPETHSSPVAATSSK